MQNNIFTFKIALMQPMGDFLKINNLPDSFILDRYRLYGNDESEFNTKPFFIVYNTIGWETNPPLGYIIELMDLKLLVLPMTKHLVLSIEDGCFTEIKVQYGHQLALNEVKAKADLIGTLFEQAGYKIKESQKDITDDSFAADRPGGSITCSIWQIAGKEDNYRYILNINETDSYSDTKKYCLVVKAQAITETMKKTFETRKAYRLEMQKKMNEITSKD